MAEMKVSSTQDEIVEILHFILFLLCHKTLKYIFVLKKKAVLLNEAGMSAISAHDYQKRG